MSNYIDIPRYKSSFNENIKYSEKISVTEKIDGSNASFQWIYNPIEERDQKGTWTCLTWSHRQELTNDNTLNGFYDWAQSFRPEVHQGADGFDHGNILPNNYRFYGEWLGHKMKVVYPNMKTFHVFDILDTDKNAWLPQEKVKRLCILYGLEYVPVLFEGTWGDFVGHFDEYCGKSILGVDPNKGEGFVVKREDVRTMDGYSNILSRDPHTFKVVREDFQEVRVSKEIDPALLEEQELAKTIITRARIEKHLYKFIEDNIIPEDWDETHMPEIAKNLPKKINEDCLKEEPEIVAQIGENFSKYAGKLTMPIVKKILMEKV